MVLTDISCNAETTRQSISAWSISTTCCITLGFVTIQRCTPALICSWLVEKVKPALICHHVELPPPPTPAFVVRRSRPGISKHHVHTETDSSQIWSFRTVVARVAAAVRPLPAHVQALVKRFQAMQRRPRAAMGKVRSAFYILSSSVVGRRSWSSGHSSILVGTLASFAGADGTSSRPTTYRVDCRVLS